MHDIHSDRILIIDFGSQYTQLIARRIREAGVYSEVHHTGMTTDEIKAFKPNGIILSGGPESVTADDTLVAPQYVFEAGVPVLGICYGMQTMAAQLGGKVGASTHREFGYAQVRARNHSALLKGIEDHVTEEGFGMLDVWMSHGDKVDALPEGFVCIASSDNAPIAGMADESRHFYGLQFHPEVTHTKQGKAVIGLNFQCVLVILDGTVKFLAPAVDIARHGHYHNVLGIILQQRFEAEQGLGILVLRIIDIAETEQRERIISTDFQRLLVERNRILCIMKLVVGVGHAHHHVAVFRIDFKIAQPERNRLLGFLHPTAGIACTTQSEQVLVVVLEYGVIVFCGFGEFAHLAIHIAQAREHIGITVVQLVGFQVDLLGLLELALPKQAAAFLRKIDDGFLG